MERNIAATVLKILVKNLYSVKSFDKVFALSLGLNLFLGVYLLGVVGFFMLMSITDLILVTNLHFYVYPHG